MSENWTELFMKACLFPIHFFSLRCNTLGSQPKEEGLIRPPNLKDLEL